MLWNIAIFLVLVLVALGGYIAARAPTFRVCRSRLVAAPPHVVYEYVNDFHKWPEWSPWEKIDPAIKKEYSGASAGQAAVYSWSGNGNVGQGRMTIVECAAAQSITIRLEFEKPWKATNTAQFDFATNGPGTTVTWSMSGRYNFIAKAMSLCLNMDKMIGANFEKGLADLDTVTAAAMKQPVPTAAPVP